MLRKLLIALALAVPISVPLVAEVASSQAFTVTLTPNAPYYAGSNGTGYWHGSWYACGGVCGNGAGNTYQVEAESFLWADNVGDVRSASGYDANSDVNLSGAQVVDSTNFLISNTPSNCPYHGLHWFGTHVLWHSRQWVPALGQWTAWTAWAWTPVSSGVYGQACV